MREAESRAPNRASPAATNSAERVTSPPFIRNSMATMAAPVVCPTSRAEASMPLAEPLLYCGAEAIIMLLLGDWNIPNPRPHTTRRHTMSKCDGAAGSSPSITSPKAMIDNPASPMYPACILSTSMPATGATTMMTMGQAVNSSPVPTAS